MWEVKSGKSSPLLVAAPWLGPPREQGSQSCPLLLNLSQALTLHAGQRSPGPLTHTGPGPTAAKLGLF